MQQHVKRVLVLTLALVFIALGIVGLVLPFLQGILFIAIGLLLLSFYSPALRGWLDTHTIKYPALHRAVRKAEEWIVSIIGKP